MNALGHLEKMLMQGEITEEEYKHKKAVYVETILELYIKGIISKEQMQEKLNQ
ncbi:MAG: SHOCT domain-containing protein [Bacteroidales bacterium]|nr:SHOCT domain-containing protein [Bacteroidales bacterium]